MASCDNCTYNIDIQTHVVLGQLTVADMFRSVQTVCRGERVDSHCMHLQMSVKTGIADCQSGWLQCPCKIFGTDLVFMLTKM